MQHFAVRVGSGKHYRSARRRGWGVYHTNRQNGSVGRISTAADMVPEAPSLALLTVVGAGFLEFICWKWLHQRGSGATT